MAFLPGTAESQTRCCLSLGLRLAADARCRNSANCFVTSASRGRSNVRTCCGRPNLTACFVLSDWRAASHSRLRTFLIAGFEEARRRLSRNCHAKRGKWWQFANKKRRVQEKMSCQGSSQVTDFASLASALARFGKVGREATNQKVESSSPSGRTISFMVQTGHIGDTLYRLHG